MASAEKIKIMVESETCEMFVKVKETDMVKDLLKIVQKAWGDGTEYMTLHYRSTQLQNDQTLSAYNIKDGSVVQVKVYAEAP